MKNNSHETYSRSENKKLKEDLMLEEDKHANKPHQEQVIFGQNEGEVHRGLVKDTALKRNVWFVYVLPIAVVAAIAWIVYAFAATPTTTNVSKSSVVAYLNSLSNTSGSTKKMLTGQHVGQTSNYTSTDRGTRLIEDMASLTGKHVGIVSADLGGGGSFDTGLSNYIVDYWKKGGMVAISWHRKNPATNGTEMDRSVNPIPNILSATSNATKTNYYNQLDSAAASLQKLKDNGVVAMYRPFHEMTIDAFWWGCQNQTQYKQLWQTEYNYLTKTKGLNNLVWVWNPHRAHSCTEKPHLSFYPGAEYVDVVGADAYECIDANRVWGTALKGLYDQLATLNKPIALPEVGESRQCRTNRDSDPLIDYREIVKSIKTLYPKVAYFTVWNADMSYKYNDHLLSGIYTSRAALKDSTFVHRGDLALFNGTVTPTPTPTPTQNTTIKGDTGTAEPRLLKDLNILWAGTFDHPTDWKSSFGISKLSFEENIRIEKPSFAIDNKAMHVITPGSTDRVNKWGVDLRTDFTKMGIGPQEAAYLRYYVYIPTNYACEGGGKFPGLSGITEGDPAYSTPSGGEYNERGWSGRIYWKQDVAGQNGCGMVSYMYVKHANGKNISNSTGRYVGIAPRWYNDANSSKGYSVVKKGQWNVIELYYKMNTPGQNNGEHKAWLNGNLSLNLNDVQYRTSNYPNLKINQIFSSIFYGGSIFPASTQHSYFDSFVLSKSYIGPRTTTSTPQPVPTTPTNPTPVPEDPAPPETNPVNITLNGLVEGQSVTGNLKVEAQPQNATAIQKVDFYVDSTLINTENDAPYSLGGDTANGPRGWNSTTVKDGAHTLRAVMTYGNNLKAERKITFTVQNRVNMVVQAENATLMAGASARADTTAIGGQSLVLWNMASNVSHTFTAPITGNYSIGGTLRSQSYRGAAKVDIYLDGNKVTTKELTATYQEFDLDNRTFSAGTKHSIKFVFINDQCGYQSIACSFSTDRNVWVDTLYMRN